MSDKCQAIDCATPEDVRFFGTQGLPPVKLPAVTTIAGVGGAADGAVCQSLNFVPQYSGNLPPFLYLDTANMRVCMIGGIFPVPPSPAIPGSIPSGGSGGAKGWLGDWVDTALNNCTLHADTQITWSGRSITWPNGSTPFCGTAEVGAEGVGSSNYINLATSGHSNCYAGAVIRGDWTNNTGYLVKMNINVSASFKGFAGGSLIYGLIGQAINTVNIPFASFVLDFDVPNGAQFYIQPSSAECGTYYPDYNDAQCQIIMTLNAAPVC